MKKKIIFSLIVWCVLFRVSAQDANFSQFYNNPVYYNPGMIALNNGYSFRTHARSLWTPVPGRFNTFSASFEGQVIPKLAMAASAFTDVAGEAALRTTGGYLTYAYRPVENKNFMLQVGLTGGVVNKSIDWSKLRFSDNYHELYGEVGTSQFIAPNYRSTNFADFGTGIVARFNHEAKKTGTFKKMMTMIGFSVLHLTKPKDGFIMGGSLPMKFVGNFQMAILLNDFVLNPAIIYENQNKFQTATVGLLMMKNPLIFGLWYRNEGVYYKANRFDSVILTFGVNLNMKNESTLKIMYSADFTVSKLRSSSFASHEISLVYNLDNRFMFQSYRAKRSRSKFFKCPSEFKGL